MKTLDEFIKSVRALPPAPRSLAQLFSLLHQDHVQAEQVVDIIRYDPALTATILKRCNGAALGLAQPVQDMLEALLRIGFDELYRMAAIAIAESTLRGTQRGYGMDNGQLWQHSVAAAVGARLTARSVGGDENAAFTAALLHDIGKMILSGPLEEARADVVNETERLGHSFVEAEKHLMGFEHAEIGGRLLERWEFPENLVRAVWHHHEPLRARPHEQLAALVCVGDMLAHLLGYAEGHLAFAVQARGEALQLLEITSREVELLVLQTITTLETLDWFNRKSP